MPTNSVTPTWRMRCIRVTRQIPWKVVANSVALLLATAALVLRWNLGHAMLNCVSRKVASFLEIPSEASQFMFGYLSTGINLSDHTGDAGHNVTGIEPAFIFGVRIRPARTRCLSSPAGYSSN